MLFDLFAVCMCGEQWPPLQQAWSWGALCSSTTQKDNRRLGPCCRLGSLALLCSVWICEAAVTDGKDIVAYVLPFWMTCNVYSFYRRTAERRQLPILFVPQHPARIQMHIQCSSSQDVLKHFWNNIWNQCYRTI